jgi:hypothetical protein
MHLPNAKASLNISTREIRKQWTPAQIKQRVEQLGIHPYMGVRTNKPGASIHSGSRPIATACSIASMTTRWL